MSNIELYDTLIKCGYTDLWLPEMEFLMHDQMEYRKHLWNDTLYVYNIINCDMSECNEKMFYKKNPDYEYRQLLDLR